jgi:uncharacterized protein YdeI (YjbR/CyaY-like superfamily)
MPDPNAERFAAETPAEWRAWLKANHARPTGVWLVSWANGTGRARMTYEEAVVEALAWGWIDSTARRLDDERTALWFAPRKAGSGWARTNKARVEQLEREGRMEPPGRAVIDRAKADGSWTLLDAVEALTVPDDLAAALASRPGASERYEAFPKSAKRAILVWIVEARTPATRERRVNEAAEKAARGERANQWQPKAAP